MLLFDSLTINSKLQNGNVYNFHWFKVDHLEILSNIPHSPTSFSYRGSYGVAKEGAMQGFSTRSRYAAAHFCCYLPYFVHVTFATLQRNGPFFQICCKLQYKINVFPPKVVSGPDSLRKSSKGRLRAIWGLMNHTYRLVF